jgi:hypothetical protein
MKAELSPVKQVKIEYWLEVIHKCRASGLTNTEFCKQNNISDKSYYYYLAKIRKMAIEDIPKKNSNLPVDWSSKIKIPVLKKYLYLHCLLHILIPYLSISVMWISKCQKMYRKNF